MRNFRSLLVVLLLAIAAPAIAQSTKPQVWTTSVVPGEFPSQAAALSAVRAKGGVYALAEQVEQVTESSSGTTYVYGATPRGPDIGPWYRYAVYIGLGEGPTEAAAIQAYKAWYQSQNPQCTVTDVFAVEDWKPYSIFSDGKTNRMEHRAYEVHTVGGCPEKFTLGDNTNYRWRNVDCPANLAWNSLDYACVKHNIVSITALPMMCVPCEMQHNPVSVSTGDKYQRETDFELPWLSFARHYHSSRSVPGAWLGPGWTHKFNQRLVSGSYGGLLQENGDFLPFYSGEAVDGSGWRMQYIGASIYEVRKPTETLTFDPSGLLTKIDYLNGNTIVLAYDAYERLTSATHSSGRSVQFVYENTLYPKAAKLVAVSEDGVELVHYSYDSAGRLEGASYPDGKARHYHYENSAYPNHLTGITDENAGRYSTYGYNADGYAVLSEHAGGLYHGTFEYRADGTTVYTDANGAAHTFAFTADGDYRKVKQSADAAGSESIAYATPGYDFRRRPTSRIDKRGVQTTYSYADVTDSVLGDVRKTTTNEAVGTPQARTTQIWRDRATDRVRKNVAPGKEAVYQYSARGQLISVATTDTATGANRTTTTTYCEQADVTAGTCPRVGLVTKVDGPRTDVNDVTTYTYYPSDDATCASAPTTCPHRKGDLWLVQDAVGNITETLKYDGAGRVLSVKDANNVVTDFEYHPRGWLTARKVRGTDPNSEADDQITRIDYFPTGLVQKTTLPDSSYTTYTYDAAHRLTDITDGDGNTLHYTLDNAGNRTKEETKGSTGTVLRTLSRVYNQLGQLQTQKDAYNHATGYTFDANGNTDTVTDALSRVTDNDYDPLNRLTKTIQDLGGLNVTTQFQYDARDNLTAVIDPKGLTTGYTYNGLGDLTQLSSPDTGVTAYTYDSAGNRKTQTDARNVTATYGYDAANRLTSVGYPDSSLNVGYSYDTAASACASGETFAAGRLSQLTDGSGSTQYCYDRFGQLVRKVQTTAGQSFTVRYGYTKAGQLSALTYPDGTVADYVRDAQGRTTEVGVTRPGKTREVLLTAASYYPFGPAAEWVFGNGRLFQRTLNQNYQPGVVQDQSAGGLSLGYEFDAVGNLVKLRNGNQSEPPLRHYGYDPLNRLSESRDGTTDALLQGYGYDATGNRTSATDAGVTTAYTLANTSHRLTDVGGTARSYDAAGNTTAIGSVRAFVYNDANRMSAVKQGGVTAMNYAYNGKGEQVSRSNASTGTTTVYDEAGHWLGEYDNSGNPSQQVVWLDDLPIGLVIGIAAASKPLHYIETDALGTPRTVIDAQRNVAVWSWSLTTEAFGKNQPDQDVDGDGTDLVFNLRFPGQRYDADTQLNYNYFRDYEPESGRYIESDPIGLQGGMNTYNYVAAKPLVGIDPLGLLVWSSNVNWGAIVFNGAYAPIPGEPAEPIDPESIVGVTYVDWDLKAECTCDGGSWVFKQFSVKLDINADIWKNMSPANDAWARRAEYDHVNDYLVWAGRAGWSTAKAAEIKFVGKRYEGEAECKRETESALYKSLRASIIPAAIATKNYWDHGRHSMNSPGRRP